MRRPDVPLKPPKPRMQDGADLRFLRRTAIVAGLLGAAILLVRLADVILLAFGAVLVAILLNAIASPLAKRTGVPRPWCLTFAVVLLVGLSGTLLWLFGSQAAMQVANLVDLLPRAWSEVQRRLVATTPGAYILEDIRRFGQADGWLMSMGSMLVRNATAGGAAAVIVLFAGLYLAFHPRTYLRGLVRLAPPPARPRAEAVLEACGEALNRWLLGQLISMILVGVTTGVGLWLAGVHAPLALGALAGLGQFIPVVGPGAAMIPGLLIALAQGPETLVWALLIYVGAMQFEANVVTPLLLRQMVELPMAVTLFAVLAMGILLGPLGVLFATPLAVIAYVLVRMVYVEGVLGDSLSPPPVKELRG